MKEIVITSKIYHSETNGYGIYKGRDNATHEETSITGNFPFKIIEGQTYSYEGVKSFYKEEEQTKVTKIVFVRPKTKYKELMLLTQIFYSVDTMEYFDKLYKTIKGNILDYVLKNRDKIFLDFKELNGEENFDEQFLALNLLINPEIMQKLKVWKFSNKEIFEGFNIYKENIIEKISENPYDLLKTLNFTFKRCDEIARLLSYNMKDDNRVKGAIIMSLRESVSCGHCYLPIEILVENSIKMLFYKGIIFTKKVIKLNTLDLIKLGDLKRNDQNVYLAKIYDNEQTIKNKILEITKDNRNFKNDITPTLEKYLDDNNIKLEDKQKEAVINFSNTKGGFYILTGGAGCGKTFTTKIILEMLKTQYERSVTIKVFAPTGKAAKVIAKAIGKKASTVHSGLGWIEEGVFSYDEYNLLHCDVLIVDETSMLDIHLSSSLFEAIRSTTKVIFLGDVNQLPSIGAGNVLKDLLNSKKVEFVELNVVKRQGVLSGINKNANLILENKMIETCPDTKDSFVVLKENSLEIMSYILRSISRLMTNRDFSIEDIQILTPQKQGVLGTMSLNYAIQQKFNKDNNSDVIENKKITSYINNKRSTVVLFFKENDKVIHTINNRGMTWQKKVNGKFIEDDSKKGIMNGETGTIYKITNTKNQKEIIVKYDDGFVTYRNNFAVLDHAYALTIHKAQGSQWKSVIIPIVKDNQKMLTRNILYTGITRAEKFNLIIGNENSIKYSINNVLINDRFTSLSEFF